MEGRPKAERRSVLYEKLVYRYDGEWATTGAHPIPSWVPQEGESHPEVACEVSFEEDGKPVFDVYRGGRFLLAYSLEDAVLAIKALQQVEE